MWFDNRVYLHRIYDHPYFDRFTNIVVCDEIKKCKKITGTPLKGGNPSAKDVGVNPTRGNPSAKDVRVNPTRGKPLFPKGMRRIEFLDDVNYLHENIFWEGITHIKFSGTRHHIIKKYNLPQSLTHIYIPHDNDEIDLNKFSRIESFGYGGYSFKTLNRFPKTLKHLQCYGDNVPCNIISLICYHLSDTILSAGLQNLTIERIDFDVTTLADFVNLKYLNIFHAYGNLDGKLPSSITHLKMVDTSKLTLTKLPESITHLSQNNLDESLVYYKWYHTKATKHLYPLHLPNLTHLSTNINNLLHHHFPKLEYLCTYSKINLMDIPHSIKHLRLKFSGSFSIPRFITRLSLDNAEIDLKSCSHNLSVTHLDIHNSININLSYILSFSISHMTLSSKCYTMNKNLLRDRGIAVKIIHINGFDPFEKNDDLFNY